MSAAYHVVLTSHPEVSLWVDYASQRGEVVDYTVALLLIAPDDTKTIRVYDSAHGFNEMHRYTRDAGRQDGARFHSGSLGEGMQTALDEVKRDFKEMIEEWRG